MKMTPDKKLMAARCRLMLSPKSGGHPFFGALVLHLRYSKENAEKMWMPTAGVTADSTLHYTEDFIDKLTLDQTVGLLSHEVMHLALRVFDRRGNRDPVIFNLAHDYVINMILQKAGLALPPNGLINKKYDGWSAERVYNDLLKNAKRIKADSFGIGQKGGCADHSSHKKQGQGDKDKDGQANGGSKGLTGQDWQRILATAAEQARQQGSMPAGLEEIIGDILSPRLHWQDIIARFVSECVRSDYSWRRPGRKSSATDIYLPSLSFSLPKVVVAIDTSGSMRTEELRTCLGEINGIIQATCGSVRALCCDAAVHWDEPEIPRAEDIKIKGRGGTSFCPVFEKLEQENTKPSCLIYLTDLYGDFPDTPPDYPVLWGVVGTGATPPPFGYSVPLQMESHRR